MSLKKRHIGRRVAGVGVGVALLVLGLEAPAMAAAPTITAISPASGPEDCVVAITGTGFDQPGALAVDTVNFTGTGGINTAPAQSFTVVSDTEIWASVPGTATTGAITVTTEPGVTANSPVFTVPATGAGDCAATITSFEPTCGLVGTVVTITGTNLLDTNGAGAIVGANVFFNPYVTPAIHTGAAESPTTLVVAVSADAVDGPIRVNGVGPAVDSTESFNVVTDPTECAAVTTDHPRSITFKLKRSGKASGVVSSTEDPAFTDCVASVPVKIQKKKKGDGWKTVRTTTTSDTGSYTAKVRNKKGKQKFRALAPKVSLGTPAGDTCLKAKSATRTI
jgi:archaellum component FlaG (FlaF/FlaG flagellin family)